MSEMPCVSAGMILSETAKEGMTSHPLGVEEIMSDINEEELFGLGLTPAGREADWQAYLKSMPVRGPDCPEEADLMEAALKQGLQVSGRLAEHLPHCEYCPAALAKYRAKIGPGSSLRQAIADELWPAPAFSTQAPDVPVNEWSRAPVGPGIEEGGTNTRPGDPQTEIAEDSEWFHKQRMLKDAIAQLPSAQMRRIVKLNWGEKCLSPEEIADCEEIPVAEVNRLLQEAKLRIPGLLSAGKPMAQRQAGPHY